MTVRRSEPARTRHPVLARCARIAKLRTSCPRCARAVSDSPRMRKTGRVTEFIEGDPTLHELRFYRHGGCWCTGCGFQGNLAEFARHVRYLRAIRAQRGERTCS